MAGLMSAHVRPGLVQSEGAPRVAAVQSRRGAATRRSCLMKRC
jgi:hypothetical protein